MTYSKPELLATETALVAIRGSEKNFTGGDGVDPDLLSIPAAYEVDE